MTSQNIRRPDKTDAEPEDDKPDAVPDAQPSSVPQSAQGPGSNVPAPQGGQGDSGVGDSTTSDMNSLASNMASLTTETVPQYDLSSSKVRKLLLFCNTQFATELKLPGRKGTDKDIESIKEVFGNMLGFNIQKHTECTAHSMQNAISTACRSVEENVGCFAVIILTHGTDGGKLYGIDKEIHIDKLLEPLKDARKLAGIPKLVFIQACRGKKKDAGIRLAADDGGDEKGGVTIPKEADFMYAFSAFEGYVAFQNPSRGSWFVEALCKKLCTNWEKMDLLRIMTLVNYQLAYEFASHAPSNPKIHNLKQISSVTTTLTKEIWFKSQSQ